MFRMMSPAKPDNIQLLAVVFVMGFSLKVTTDNTRQFNQGSISHCSLYCSMRLMLLRILQFKLLAVLFIVARIVVTDLSDPCAVAFLTASFQAI